MRSQRVLKCTAWSSSQASSCVLILCGSDEGERSWRMITQSLFVHGLSLPRARTRAWDDHSIGALHRAGGADSQARQGHPHKRACSACFERERTLFILSNTRGTRLLELRDVQEAFLLHQPRQFGHDGHVLGDVEGVRPEGGETVFFVLFYKWWGWWLEWVDWVDGSRAPGAHNGPTAYSPRHTT